MPFWRYFSGFWTVFSMEPWVWTYYLVLGQKTSVTNSNQQIGNICFSVDFRQFRTEQNAPMCLIFLYLDQFSSLRKTFGDKRTVWV